MKIACAERKKKKKNPSSMTEGKMFQGIHYNGIHVKACDMINDGI